jgi:hypothetical protein
MTMSALNIVRPFLFPGMPFLTRASMKAKMAAFIRAVTHPAPVFPAFSGCMDTAISPYYGSAPQVREQQEKMNMPENFRPQRARP